jgi:hypothetical protein
VLRQTDDVPRQRADAAAKTRSLESWLEVLSREDLLTLVREQLQEDRGLRRRLELRVAAAGSDLSAARARVRELLDVRTVSRSRPARAVSATLLRRDLHEGVLDLDPLPGFDPAHHQVQQQPGAAVTAQPEARIAAWQQLLICGSP